MNPCKKMQQQRKERIDEMHQHMARWVYESNIPFHHTSNVYFRGFVEVVGQFGSGYQPPNLYQLREPVLKEDVERTKSSLKEQEKEWGFRGYSIMTDAWSNGKRRTTKFCVNWAKGTTFISSKEDFEKVHTGEYIFQYVNKCIEEVGPQNVVQIVTDYASNNVAAAKLLSVPRPSIFWTSCTTHTLNLMLEAIGKLVMFEGAIERAKDLTIFINTHYKTLSLMWKFTKKRDIMRSEVTRFANSFLTLQSLMEKKNLLRLMFTSEEWGKCKWSKSVEGIVASDTVLSISFWDSVSLCLNVFTPLVKMFLLVNGDKNSSMGFLYGKLKQAKEEIKETLKNVETHYKSVIEIIDSKAEGHLDSPIHLAAYILNPYYYYKDQSIEDDPIVMNGLLICIEKFFSNDFDMQNHVTNVELLKYKNREGLFGHGIAVRACTKYDENFKPVVWWSNFGCGTPNLQRIALAILSLTTTACPGVKGTGALSR
ncbi:hypothetical protein LguiB_018575 [Lonicera macranthoides]